MEKRRCLWAQNVPSYYQEYHDVEWGVPIHDDQELFEFLILEGMQAGLSWNTILQRRKTFRIAFDNFDVKKVSQYDEYKIAELLQDPGIIRNKLKVNAAIINARNFLIIQQEFGSFDKYLWRYVDYKPIINYWKCSSEVPASTELSDQISKDLKKRGFKFVGTTIIYAYLQAVGVVNDHEEGCFCKEK